MISAVSSVVLAIVLGLKTPFLAPFVFLTRFFKKELSAMLFFLYCVILSYEIFVSDILDTDYETLTLGISAILLLEESISSRRRNFIDYVLTAFVLSGFIAPILILFVLLIAIFNIVLNDRATIGLAAIFCPVFAYMLVAFLDGEDLSLTAQIFVLASLTIMLFLISSLSKAKLKNIEKS